LKIKTNFILNKAILLGFALFAIFFFIGCTTNNLENENEITFSGFVLKETYLKNEFSFYNYSDENQKIEIQLISEIKQNIANQIISDKIAMFQSLFEKKRVDYPGQYSQYIECPAEFKPIFEEKEILNGKISFFRTFSNSNYVSGACSPDLAVYKSIYGLLFCEETQKLYEISYFTNLENEPTNRINSFLGGIKCGN
jgi:hypothetical protein